MALVPYTNTGKANIHLSGKTIQPGETREIDETQIPGFGVDENHIVDAIDMVEPNPLALVLAGSVKEVTAALDGLSADDLDILEALEGDAEHPRKGVLDAINKQQLALAQADVA